MALLVCTIALHGSLDRLAHTELATNVSLCLFLYDNYLMKQLADKV